MSRRPRVVVLGMMSKIPVSGVVWQNAHYLTGLERLGYEAYYVEAHARTPGVFMETDRDDGSGRAAAFIDTVMRRFGLADRWAFHALHDDGRCYGLSASALGSLYREAALIINLHGATYPPPEHGDAGLLVYLETDPVHLQVELHNGSASAAEFLAAHDAFFSFGENYAGRDCGLPQDPRFHFRATRQPVLRELWGREPGPGRRYTTVGSWRQPGREIHLAGETYGWSKDEQFASFIGLPASSGASFELALSRCDEEDRAMLQAHGWRVRDAWRGLGDASVYRDYIRGSRAEFTVAKEQNVRLRTGWFSDRSATYLAAGRPVVTQETGFAKVLPTGEGLFGVTNAEDARGAIEAIESDYERHARAALELAREYFDAEVVLGRLLGELGLAVRRTPAAGPAAARLPDGLSLRTVSRWPTRLSEPTVRRVLAAPVPQRVGGRRLGGPPTVSIIVATRDALPFTRLCLESVLADPGAPAFELIVVDNGSGAPTREYLRALAARWPCVQVRFNEHNRGFAAAVNQGVEAAGADALVLLNNDTVVTPGWLARLTGHLDDPAIGLISAVTNRAACEAQIETDYDTYGELLELARARASAHAGQLLGVRGLVLFCAALRREVFEQVGRLDEGFELGLFEDDDYVLRVQRAGYRVVCAEAVFVHHFGQATLGGLERHHGSLFHANRERFEQKWGLQWRPHPRRPSARRELEAQRVRAVAGAVVPAGSSVVVVSRGDHRMLELEDCRAAHFPPDADGLYAGFYPADSAEAIAALEAVRTSGAEFLLLPETGYWWLDHYAEFRRHLEHHYPAITAREDACLIFALTADVGAAV